MVLDTETVFLLHFKAEIWQEREFNGGHFEFQDGRQLPWQPRWVPGFKKKIPHSSNYTCANFHAFVKKVNVFRL